MLNRDSLNRDFTVLPCIELFALTPLLQWKCCYSRSLPSVQDGCNWDACSARQRQAACSIIELYETNRIYLKPNHFNSLGNNPYDGASSLSEIRDMCYGKEAHRSAYGVAPGGCVCLQANMMESLYDYAVSFYSTYGLQIEVNALAGSEHSANSYHYTGNTWDVSCSTPINHCNALRDYCLSLPHVEACYPGSSCGGHDTWVHCALTYD